MCHRAKLSLVSASPLKPNQSLGQARPPRWGPVCFCPPKSHGETATNMETSMYMPQQTSDGKSLFPSAAKNPTASAGRLRGIC